MTVTAPAPASFEVTVAGTGPLTYQWKQSTDGVNFSNVSSGGNGGIYNIPITSADMSGTEFECVVTSSVGSVTSAPATLTVNLLPLVPSFTTQPVSATVTAPATATFIVAATGTPSPSYQWMQSVNGGVSYTNISGATSASYTTSATAAANSGTLFKCVAFNNSGVATSNPATLTVNPATLGTYTVTASAGSGGSIVPSGPVIVSSGANQSFTITPNTGYQIAGVTVNGVLLTTTPASYTFSNLSANGTINVTFTPITYIITATTGSNGSISPASATVAYGGSQVFTLTPAAGYTAILTVDGTAVALTSNTYTLSNVMATHTLAATFTKNNYAITTTAGANGTISPMNPSGLSQQPNLYCKLSDGYTASLTLDGTAVALTNNTYTLSNVMAIHTLAASFSQNTYAITATAGANGTISPLNATVAYGGSQVFTLTPAAGYTASLTLDGAAVALTNNGYTLSNVMATHTLAAAFTKNSYAITTTAGANGTISPMNPVLPLVVVQYLRLHPWLVIQRV